MSSPQKKHSDKIVLVGEMGPGSSVLSGRFADRKWVLLNYEMTPNLSFPDPSRPADNMSAD